MVFSALTLAGAGLMVLTAVSGVDEFYPLFGFGLAVYVAWQRFF
jgi:hypothetical protein